VRNKILGGIGVLWGGAIVVAQVLGQESQGSEAYQTGQTAALVFGVLMFAAGLYYFFKKPKSSNKEQG